MFFTTKLNFGAGIKVTPGSTYSASFYYRFPTASSFSGTATVSLQTTGGEILGSSTVTLSGSQTSWVQVTTQIVPTINPGSTSNQFAITLSGAAAAGQTINFAMLSLFPPTFNNRPNGMREDIATILSEMGPSFFRFPGGNNLEGQTFDQRWQWNATVGPLVDRPGRVGDWGYINTDGLGLLEYLEWCEDLNMTPIMAIWSGFSLGGDSVAEADLGPYIQQAADQINFVIGEDGTSAPASLRASLGHPEPFSLTYVEVGNEGEYAAISTNASNIFGTTSDGRLTYPTMQSSTGEAAYMTGLERNSDIVFAASYAPLLNQVDDSQWTPNLVSFDAGSVYPSTSYYVQKLFSLNRGNEYLPSTLPSADGTLFWSVVREPATQSIIIKVVNTISTETPITFVLPFSTVATSGTLQLLQGSETTSNTPTDPTAAVPVKSTISTGKTFTYEAPGFSISVITLVAH
ncbi:hypothetical protein H0H92_009737 [Tricholoma furcatifolium]|nr:hypothetical protein H0H92_009737 [Tricholoma furcatifolium]